MSDKSKIEWTATVNVDGSTTPGSTWNPVRGCVKVSAGCKNCYAETFAERWRGVKGHPYEQGFDLRLVPEKLLEPLKWKKPRRVFVNSMSDLFQDGVPFEYVDKVFAVMALTTHTYQILTKRPDRMLNYINGLTPGAMREAAKTLNAKQSDPWDFDDVIRFRALPLDNVWLGVSVENQATADERIPLLLQTPAAVRFVSYEPALGSANFSSYLPPPFEIVDFDGVEEKKKLDWVIVGGESGPGARPMDIEWVRSVIRQCKAAGTACFVKQMGSVPMMNERQWRHDIEVTGWARSLSATNHKRVPEGFVPLRYIDRKGGDMNEWPEDLRARQMPS